jgi:hypothetical protein
VSFISDKNNFRNAFFDTVITGLHDKDVSAGDTGTSLQSVTNPGGHSIATP